MFTVYIEHCTGLFVFIIRERITLSTNSKRKKSQKQILWHLRTFHLLGLPLNDRLMSVALLRPSEKPIAVVFRI